MLAVGWSGGLVSVPSINSTQARGIFNITFSKPTNNLYRHGARYDRRSRCPPPLLSQETTTQKTLEAARELEALRRLRGRHVRGGNWGGLNNARLRYLSYILTFGRESQL